MEKLFFHDCEGCDEQKEHGSHENIAKFGANIFI